MSIAVIDNTVEGQVDRLGELNAQIAKLEAEAKILKANLIIAAGGEDKVVFLGEKYRAAVSTFEVAKVDYKSIVEKVGVSRQMLVANTKVSVSQRVALSDL